MGSKLALVGIILITLGLLLTIIFHNMHIRTNCELDIRNTISQIHRSLDNYFYDYGSYPPDGKEGDIYSETALVKYLDGNSNNGGPNKKYYDFDADNYNSVRNMQYVDKKYNCPYMYRNLRDDNLLGSKRHKDPREAEIFIKSFQIYHQVNDKEGKHPEKWITNYQ